MEPSTEPNTEPNMAPSQLSYPVQANMEIYGNQKGTQHGLLLVWAWPTNIQEMQNPFKKTILFGDFRGMICVGPV